MRDVGHLVNELLYNRDIGGDPRPTPVTVLLGPAGSGKSAALDAVSAHCGETVIHARFDFRADHHPEVVEVLAKLAFELARGWRHRPPVTFRRLTLSLVVSQADLAGLSRDDARARVRTLVDSLSDGPRSRRAAATVSTFADLAGKARILPDPVIEAVKAALPQLIKATAKARWIESLRWTARQPVAEGAGWIDSLIQVNSLARTDPRRFALNLCEAFLADVRTALPRSARIEERVPCSCPGVQGRPHWHNWVILLDGIDHRAGEEFLRTLLTAREHAVRNDPRDWDQLLLIGASRIWLSALEPTWQPVWTTAPASGSGPAAPATYRQAVRPVRDTHRSAWPDVTRADGSHAYLPALLQPMMDSEVAETLQVPGSDPRRVLVSRATGGLPRAVEYARTRLDQLSAAAGSRDPFGALEPAVPSSRFWSERMREAGLSELQPRIRFDDLIAATAFATAPWLISTDTAERVGYPDIGPILTALRSSLWVTAGPADGATEHHALMNPWISRGLQYALADRRGDGGAAAERPGSYRQSFERLLADPETTADEARVAYCHLALARVDEACDYFIRTFDTLPHRTWLARLALVASAPDNLDLDTPAGELFSALGGSQTSQSSAGYTIRRLLVASWLTGNTLAVPDKKLQADTADSLLSLVSLSRQSDVAALYRAADAARGFW